MANKLLIVVTTRNCGTGEGGFQPGNSCGGGGGGSVGGGRPGGGSGGQLGTVGDALGAGKAPHPDHKVRDYVPDDTDPKRFIKGDVIATVHPGNNPDSMFTGYVSKEPDGYHVHVDDADFGLFRQTISVHPDKDAAVTAAQAAVAEHANGATGHYPGGRPKPSTNFTPTTPDPPGTVRPPPKPPLAVGRRKPHSRGS